MKPRNEQALRCAIYTRKSSEEGLEQEFNSLHAQREACEAYIRSQQGEGWRLRKTHYDDGGLSGATMERPALKQLLADIEEGLVDVVVVYKVDRLTRSLSDFARMVEIFDGHQVSFVAVTQQFNTTTSMGRLTLNVLLSFAQFEREVTGERIRDKIAASKRKGMWMGGLVPLGYEVPRALPKAASPRNSPRSFCRPAAAIYRSAGKRKNACSASRIQPDSSATYEILPGLFQYFKFRIHRRPISAPPRNRRSPPPNPATERNRQNRAARPRESLSPVGFDCGYPRSHGILTLG
jgi:DNA invertase Pin-like site-specific DNA recombinase